MNPEEEARRYIAELERIYPDTGVTDDRQRGSPTRTPMTEPPAHRNALDNALYEGRSMLNQLQAALKEAYASKAPRDSRSTAIASNLALAAMDKLGYNGRANDQMETTALAMAAADHPSRLRSDTTPALTARRMQRCRAIMLQAAVNGVEQMKQDAQTVDNLGYLSARCSMEWSGPETQKARLSEASPHTVTQAALEVLATPERILWNERVKLERHLSPGSQPDPEAS